MFTLKNIIKNTTRETEERKELFPLALLKKSSYYDSPCISFKSYIHHPEKTGIIAEFKRKSPSEGILNAYAPVKEVTMGYMQSGASALSILTDRSFFGGSLEDLKKARQYNFCPILRKDFIIDPYQIHESRSAGADAILLIASILSKEHIKNFVHLAHDLGMEVLLEFHTAEEIREKYVPEVDCVGINNRNLGNMQTSIEAGMELAGLLPDNTTRIAESGIRSVADVMALRQAGFHGFLIGTRFMQATHPHQCCQQFNRTLFESTRIDIPALTSGVLGI